MDNNKKNVSMEELHEDFHKNFVPDVHKIGTITMLAALALSILPTIYFVFIKGIDVPLSAFLAVIAAIASFAIGMWLSEPAAFWPVMGSAGTYFAFLSGNASSMRLPVALTAASSVEEADDMENPKVHIAMIIALFASVVVNLAILLVIVLIGDALINILPASVLAAFGFIMPCLIANNVVMRSKGKGGTIIPGFISILPYLIAGFVAQVLCKYVFTALSGYGTLCAVLLSLVVAFVIYKIDLKKAGY